MNTAGDIAAECSHIGRVGYGGACEFAQAEMEERLRI